MVLFQKEAMLSHLALAVLVLTCSMSAPLLLATVTPHIAAHSRLTNDFIQTVRLPLTKVKGRIAKVSYGNQHYGYFTSDHFKVTGESMRLSLIPPGYKYPIEFHVTTTSRRGDRTSMVGRLTFKSPLPPSYEGITIRTKGEFSRNFYIVSAALPRSRLANSLEPPSQPDMPMRNKSRFTFLMIVNRLGEIVWTYMPHRQTSHFNNYIYGRPLGGGRYGFVLGKKDGYFAIVDYRGRKLSEIDFKSASKGRRYPMHHDFDIGPDDQLYTITNKLLYEKKEKKSYVTNMILRVDLETKRPTIAKDLLDFYHPSTELHWTENRRTDRFVTWGAKLADHDFTHANSIRFITGMGVLLSLKHLDRVVLLSADLDEIKWSVGRTARDTFRTSGETMFSHQHAPSMLADDRMLLFDNGFEKQESRVIELQLDHATRQTRLVWEYKPQPTLYSRNRSSAVKLENGNVLAFFVDPTIAGQPKPKNSRVDIMLEIDHKTRRDIAAMRFFYMTASPGYRAEPIDVIGTESYIGRDF